MCSCIRSVTYHKCFHHLAAQSLIAKRFAILCVDQSWTGCFAKGLSKDQQFAHSTLKMIWERWHFPFGVEHDQGLVNLLPSATVISCFCAASKSFLSQPNCVFILHASSQSPVLLNPAKSIDAEGAVFIQMCLGWFFFDQILWFLWLQCTCHRVNLCQALAFTPKNFWKQNATLSF